jgi:hypothetical protein
MRNGVHVLAVQGDGNVVIYRPNWTARWHTGTGH